MCSSRCRRVGQRLAHLHQIRKFFVQRHAWHDKRSTGVSARENPYTRTVQIACIRGGRLNRRTPSRTTTLLLKVRRNEVRPVGQQFKRNRRSLGPIVFAVSKLLLRLTLEFRLSYLPHGSARSRQPLQRCRAIGLTPTDVSEQSGLPVPASRDSSASGSHIRRQDHVGDPAVRWNEAEATRLPIAIPTLVHRPWGMACSRGCWGRSTTSPCPARSLTEATTSWCSVAMAAP